MAVSLLGLPFLVSTNLVGAYYSPNGNSGWGGVEAKAIYKMSTKQKMFEAEHPLLKNNNIVLSGWGEFSPVSFNAGANTSWEFVPFAKLNVGGTAGTGWTLLGFNGLGRNFPTDNAVRKEPFSGLVTKAWLEGALQFDWAAVQPGEWNHVVAYVAESREYRSNSAADQNTAWEYENDSGVSLNGWKRNRTFVFGYQMPLTVSMVGFLATSELHITHKNDSPMAAKGWASNFEIWKFGPMMTLNTSTTSQLTTLLQWITKPQYTAETRERRHFALREYERPQTRPYRLALNWEAQL
jgi:hypothetical protein